MQFSKGPHLLPTDVPKDSLTLLQQNAIDLEFMLKNLDGKANLTVAVFDACREIPELTPIIQEATRASGLGASEYRGLGRVQSKGKSRIIAYAGAAGELVKDGNGEHSPYTTELLQQLEQPNQEIGDTFRNVAYQFGQKHTGQEPEVLIQGVPSQRFFLSDARPKANNNLNTSDNSVTLANAVPYVAPKTRPVEPNAPAEPVPDYGIEMVRIQPGCFQMVNPASESGRYDDERQHQVCIKQSYALGKTEVTQGQWRQVMGNNPSYFTNCGENCPVEEVSWGDVQVFIKKLNAHTAGGYRLPTEAEWEYACRSGGKEQTYCGGNNPKTLAWYDANSGNKTHPVGKKQANGLGLYDMSGNVWEWTCSAYTESDYNGNEKRCSNDTTARRVLRGGSWFIYPEHVRAAFRVGNDVTVRNYRYGFRLAQDY